MRLMPVVVSPQLAQHLPQQQLHLGLIERLPIPFQ